MGEMLKVGIIGVGIAGNSHLKGFKSVNNAQVIAISDINERVLETIAQKFKINKAFTDYHDLIALDEVEAVIICTPPSSHLPITCDAASSSKHVLCEKPMAMNAHEAKRMVETCNEANVKLGICSARRRFNPAFEMAKQYIAEGKLGQVYYARFSFFHRRGRMGIDMSVDTKWFSDSSKAGGGALMDIGCYDIDAILYLLDSPQPLSVSAMTFKGIEDHPALNTPFDVEEHSSLFVRFEKDVTTVFETATASNLENTRDYMILGTKGGLKLNPFTYYAKINGQHRSIRKEIKPMKRGDDYVLLLNDFVKACLNDNSPKTPGEDGLKNMQIISMAYKSAETKQEVYLSNL